MPAEDAFVPALLTSRLGRCIICGLVEPVGRNAFFHASQPMCPRCGCHLEPVKRATPRAPPEEAGNKSKKKAAKKKRKTGVKKKKVKKKSGKRAVKARKKAK